MKKRTIKYFAKQMVHLNAMRGMMSNVFNSFEHGEIYCVMGDDVVEVFHDLNVYTVNIPKNWWRFT